MSPSEMDTPTMRDLAAILTLDGDLTQDPPIEQAPAYTEHTFLTPITAVQNPRYDRNPVVHPEYMNIPKGLHSTVMLPEPLYLPEGWTMQSNPEGSSYYFNENLHIMTDTPMHKRDFCDKIAFCFEGMQALIRATGQVLPKNYEIYMRTDEGRDGCRYYMIDHDSQTQFWIQDIDSYELELPQVTSVGHLKFVLQEHYWTHVEYFPHRPIDKRSRDELVDVLRHARGDHMTSTNSTFPYGADQCAKFIEIIDIAGAENSTYMTCMIARLWTTVARYRFDNYHGEDYARLARDRRRRDAPVVKRSRGMKMCTSLLFGFPKAFKNDLEMLFVDNMAYAIHWRTFACTLTNNWRESSLLAGCLLIANASLLSGSKGVAAQCTGVASTILSLGGLSSSVALLHWYSGATELTAAYVANHMKRIEHENLGFEPIAAVYSLPKALIFWSMIFLATHIIAIVVNISGIVSQTTVMAIAVMVAASFWQMEAILRNAYAGAADSTDAEEESVWFFNGAVAKLRKIGAVMRRYLPRGEL